MDARTFARLRTTPVGVPQGVPAEALRLAQSPQYRGKKVVYASVQTYRMLYAFENGRLVRQLPVRPGGIALGHDGLLHRYGTAVGVTRQVWTKHPVTDLGGWGAMPYALRTTPDSYAFIHQAVGSSHPNANGHGCLNVLTGAPWLYNWAPAGLPVVYAA